MLTSHSMAAKKCVEIIDYTPSAEFTGLRRSMCAGILSYDYAWIDEDIIAQTADPSSTTCQQESQFLLDNQLLRAVSQFNDTVPSSLCQQSFMATMCYSLYPECDPEDDSTTTTPPLPCSYLCDLITTPDSSNPVCSSTEMSLMYDTYQIKTLFPQLNSCTNTTYWNTDTSSCAAPAALPSYTPIARCESYSGTFCSGVFSTSTQVYLDPWASQTDLESYLSARSYEFNILPQDSMCTQSMLIMWCQSAYSECFNNQGSSVASLINTQTGTQTPSSHRIPLYPPISTCENTNEYCADTNYFILRYNNSIDCTAQTRNTTTCDIAPNAHAVQNTLITLSEDNINNILGDINPNQPHSLALTTSPATIASHFATTASTTPDPALTAPVLTDGQVGLPLFLSSTQYATLNWQTSIANTFIRGFNFAASSDLKVTYIPYVDCPGRLVVPDDVITTSNVISAFDTWTPRIKTVYGGRCAVPCPPPAYAPNEYVLMERSSEVTEGISIPLMIILSLTFIIFRSQRSKFIVFWFTLTYLAMLIILLVGTSVVSAHPLVTCNGTTSQAQMYGFGLWQSMFVIYFTLCTCNWWLMQAVDIFEKLILGRSLHRGSREWFRHAVAMHLFCWITPGVSIIALIVGSQLGYNGFMSYAWVAFDQHMTSDPINLEWAFVFVPLLSVLVIALVLSGIVIYALVNYNHTKGIQKFHAQLQSKHTIWAKIQAVTRLMGYLFVMVFFLAVLIAIRAHTFQGLPIWHNAFQKWGRCLVAEGTDCRLDARLTPQLVALMNVTFSIPGLVLFVLYFGNSELWRLWCGLFYYQCGIPLCKSCALEDTIDTGSQTNSSTGSRGTDLLTGATVAHSNGSTDMSSAGNFSKEHDTIAINNNNNNNNNSSGGNNSSNASLVGPAASGSSVTRSQTKQKAVQRQALFKGFKSNKIIASTTRNGGSLPTSASFTHYNSPNDGSSQPSVGDTEEYISPLMGPAHSPELTGMNGPPELYLSSLLLNPAENQSPPHPTTLLTSASSPNLPPNTLELTDM